jgi:hypothetical protein
MYAWITSNMLVSDEKFAERSSKCDRRNPALDERAMVRVGQFHESKPDLPLRVVLVGRSDPVLFRRMTIEYLL